MVKSEKESQLRYQGYRGKHKGKTSMHSIRNTGQIEPPNVGSIQANTDMSGQGLNSKVYQNLKYYNTHCHARGSSEGRVQSEGQHGIGLADVQQAHITQVSKETRSRASSFFIGPKLKYVRNI